MKSMAKQPQDNHLSDATRLRLIEAAGGVFADEGFKKATVREICTRAGANVAAVNYHFGGKEGLYAEVLRFAHRCSSGSGEEAAGGTAEQRLEKFVQRFLEHIFADGRAAWHGRLMIREFAEPTAALDALVKDEMEPRSCLIQDIVKELLGPGATADEVGFCARSVMGQMIFYYHARPVIERLFKDFTYDAAGIEKVARHVTKFSIAAMACYRKGGRK